MFRLQSKTLKREFKVVDGTLYASQIDNLSSGMKFIPDGSGSEFSIKFADGDELSAKSLKVVETAEKNGRLIFKFEETFGTTVVMSYRVAKDEKTLEKQLIIKQSEPKVIDYIVLENIGITNSTTNFSVPIATDYQTDDFYSNLGQPFYIDSLFFGCEFPATKNEIVHGRGQITYYLGKSVDDKLICPVTVMGGAKENTLLELKKSFFEYISSISVSSSIRFQYNGWFNHRLNIDADYIEKSFYEVEKNLSNHGVEPLDAYVVDDGWNNYKGEFWSYNAKKFPNGFLDISSQANKLGSNFGLWLSPRGGNNFSRQFAKKIEKSKLGYYNEQSDDICVGSETYLKNLEEFLIHTTLENDVAYWKFNGFSLLPCTNSSHDHITGGDHEMYYITEMWQKWIEIFKKLRETRKKHDKDLWINIVDFINPSPWWLQYINSIWLQNSKDIDFSSNYPEDEQSKVDAQLTYKDSKYFDTFCKNAIQFPISCIFNHGPAYARGIEAEYSDDEFEKYVFWNACRGQNLNELYISSSKMNDEKWTALANALRFQRANQSILKNAMFIGGKPDENNIYCYASWTEDGEGVIALRNPTNEATSLTLTLNKLMGCPEDLSNVKRFNIYNKSSSETDELYSYNDKINLMLNPFEIKIYQFGKEDKRPQYNYEANEFTISFTCDGNDGVICQNNDILIEIVKGEVKANVGVLRLHSDSILTGTTHKITLVREKNKMLKIYIDNFLDCSGFDKKAKPIISTELSSTADDFKVVDKSTKYNQIITLEDILKSKKRKKRKQ